MDSKGIWRLDSLQKGRLDNGKESDGFEGFGLQGYAAPADRNWEVWKGIWFGER